MLRRGSCPVVNLCATFSLTFEHDFQDEGQDIRYQDQVRVNCNSGYTPAEQYVVCDESGTLGVPDPCELQTCGELYIPNAQILCTRQARTSPSEAMEYAECSALTQHNPWETFVSPNEFKIVCEPGYQGYSTHPNSNDVTTCSINGTYTPYPECLDFNECEADVFGPVSTCTTSNCICSEPS